MTLFLLDANVLIDAHRDYYPIDAVPEFWDWLLHHAANGAIKVPFETLDEILEGQDSPRGREDLLVVWIKEHRRLLELDEEVNPATVQEVQRTGYAPDLTDIEIETIARDPFLIAYALGDAGRCVVTNEVRAPTRSRKNRKIPDVCIALSVNCCNIFAMNRTLGFRTSWRSSIDSGD